jgi:hypothetical protein
MYYDTFVKGCCKLSKGAILMKLMLRFIILISLIVSSGHTFAQEADGGDDKGMFENSMKDVYTVIGVGFGGAILGLSTLSFAEEPKENLKNVLTGAAIGIILGVGIVAYKHATKSSKQYKENVYHQLELKDFSTNERLRWHKDQVAASFYQEGVPFPHFSYQFAF